MLIVYHVTPEKKKGKRKKHYGPLLPLLYFSFFLFFSAETKSVFQMFPAGKLVIRSDDTEP